MSLIFPKNKKEISALLVKDPYLNLYAIGDLDKRFEPYVNWYGLERAGKLTAVICIYESTDEPTILALSDNPDGYMQDLLELVIPHLPPHFQAHLSPGLEQTFIGTHSAESANSHYKMALLNPAAVETADASAAVQLGKKDIPSLMELYDDSYPGNWFEAEMLELNRYFGIFENNRLTAAAGTHVYSPEYSAAAVGNIAVRPEYRGRGYGANVTAGLCRLLLSEGLQVGLNIKTDNHAAAACYRKIGFEIIADYGEFIFRKIQ